MDTQIDKMCEEFPDRKVGLITFEEGVSVIGDGI
jgi:hypothetical protein